MELPELQQEVDIPSSPPALPCTWVPRKRALSLDDNLSSDPIFSEDASEADEQLGHRTKRFFKGPWWAHGPRKGPTRAPVKFADSGVWLASDASQDSLDSVTGQLQACNPNTLDDHEGSPRMDKPLPDPEELASRIVLDCVENGKETVDLSDMDLRRLDGDILTPLNQMIISKSMDHPDSDSFAPMTPDIGVYLSTNSLTALPAALWDVHNITVLSVRNNSLSELPAGIGKLRRLKELSIAGNDIKTLPWELLELITDRHGETLRLTTHPNPLCAPVDHAVISAHTSVSPRRPKAFVEPIGDRAVEDSCMESADEIIFAQMIKKVQQSWRRKDADGSPTRAVPMFGASSRVHYYEVDGTACRTAARTQQEAGNHWPADFTAMEDLLRSRSSAPSLLDLAARSLLRRSQDLELALSLSSSDTSALNPAVVRSIRNSQRRELPRCSVCSKSYIFKRAEWVEYWHCSMDSRPVPAHLLFLPFLRMSCSWGCVARAFGEHDTKRL